MRLLCMRHGQSDYNVLGLCNDDPARNVRLTALGRQQARDAARRLVRHPLDRVFCSRLPRTRETAELAVAGRGIAIKPHPALDDIRSGCDGLPVEAYFRGLGADRLRARVGNGETLLEHKARVLGFVQWLAPRPFASVLVVAHEETLRVFAAAARGLPDADMIGLAFDNCEVLELELSGDGGLREKL